MLYVARVRLREAGRAYDFDTGGLQLVPGDHCIVRTDRGEEYGVAVSETRVNPPGDPPEATMRVLRIATDEDSRKVELYREEEGQAFEVCRVKIAEHELPMKLVDAEKSFDGSRITFYFTAEGRVDFRELVKDLAKHFRTRIELRQIGVRDEAKMAGGMGPCGLACCCCTFLQRFEPVSIRMAREQRLSLNPTKISGLCGRLMCCLTYENEEYRKFHRTHRIEGETIDTPLGRGTVKGLSMVRESARVVMEDGRTVEVALTDVGKKPEIAEPIDEMPDTPEQPTAEVGAARQPAPPAEAPPGAERPKQQTADQPKDKKPGTKPSRRRPRRRRRKRKPGGGQGQ